MTFVHEDTKLRTRPTKESALVSQDAVPKNTVVIPINRKGKWVPSQKLTVFLFLRYLVTTEEMASLL